MGRQKVTKERFWELFFYWRDCLRKYVAKNAITISFMAAGFVITWTVIVIAAVVNG
jgi:hypothetical protein